MIYSYYNRKTIKKNIAKTIRLLLILLLCSAGIQLNAQVNSYTFTQSPGTYTALTAGTLVARATSGATLDPGLMDNLIYTLPDSVIPFDFGYDGWVYRTLKISTNGFITFDTIAPTAANVTPLSSIETYVGAISALGVDLSANTNSSNLGDISYQVTGSAPNRSFVIQYTKFRRKSTSSTFSENFNFQIRLNENGGVLGKQTISIVYGACTATANSTAQVGLRGPNNTFPTNVNNRMNPSTTWAASIAGTANNSTMRHTASVSPATGQTYTWTPQTGESCSDNPLTIPIYADSATAASSPGLLLVTGYSQDGPDAQCFDQNGNTTERDRWAKFVAPITGNRLVITTVEGTNTDMLMEIWTACPGSGYARYCSDDVNNFMPELDMCNYVGGQTYYVRLWPYWADSVGNFTVKVYQNALEPCPVPPVNDDCINATTLAVNEPSAYADSLISGTTIDSYLGADAIPGCASVNDTIKDVWYSFNSGNNCSLNLYISPNFGIINYGLYSGCGGTALSCVTNINGFSTLTGLSPNTTYKIRVWSTYADVGVYGISLTKTPIPACIPLPTSPAYGAAGIADCGTTLSWPASDSACSYDVYLNAGTSATTKVSSSQAGTTYATGALLSNQGYAWRVVPRNSTGAATGCSTFLFTTGSTNDGNPCTIDACNTLTGIIHTDVTPATPVVTVVNNCGNSTLTASGYTGTLAWNTGDVTPSILVTIPNTYSVTQTVNGCASNPGSGVSVPKAIPSPPAVTVVNNCGTSTLTASSFTGTLLWSNSATTTSITVPAGVYTVTQTVNGCVSGNGAGTASPKIIPATPIITKQDTCGFTTLSASNFTGTLLWSTGASTPSINVPSGSYTVTQTLNGCTSASASSTASPTALPATPVITPVNNCGNSVLTASGFTFPLLWSTGATGTSITVTISGSYTVTQKSTVTGCTSNAATGTASPKAVPSTPVVTVSDNCGNSVLTATGTTNPLSWSTGASSTSITVTTSGTYTVTQTNAGTGCTSAAGSGTASPKTVPSAPVVTVSDNCDNSVLTASGFSGTLLWSNTSTTTSITVTTGGVYSVTQSLNGCTSAAGSNTASPKVTPPAPTVTVFDSCGGSKLTASNYSGSLLWSTGATTVFITTSLTNTRTVTQTVNGCTSSAGSGTPAPKTVPTVPNVSTSNSCGSSTLTVTSSYNALLWSTGATTAAITVTSVANYTVNQIGANGCVSSPRTVSAAPLAVPTAPTVTVSNSCAGSTLTASNYTGTLLWSTGVSTAGISVSTAGTYTVTQRGANNCVSPAGSGVASPLPLPATPVIAVTDNCGSSTLTVSNYTGTLLWSNGYATPSITVNTGGSYSVTQTNAQGCTSAAGSGSASPKVVPVTPTVGVSDGCGSSVLSAGGYTGTLLWSTGSNSSSITVAAQGTYTVTQTFANGCTSSGAGATASPRAIPSAPTVSVNDNCGSSTLTAGNYTGTLLWSTGASSPTITVGAGSYTVIQTNAAGCSSSSAGGTAAPKSVLPAPVISVTNSCTNAVLTASGYTGTLLWSTGATTPSITVTTAGNITATQTGANGCVSAAGVGNASPTAPTPKVTVFNNCNSTVLTASNYTGTLLWNNNATTPTITVTTPGTYSVTQTVGACTSLPVSNQVIVYNSVNNISFNLKLFIEGFYIGNETMMPVIDPVALPDICDSITLSLYYSDPPFDPAYSVMGVLDIYGNAIIPMPNIPCGTYYLAVKHRNSMELWSKQPFIIGNPNTYFDFAH